MATALSALLKPALRMAGITQRPGITPSTDQYTELIPAMNRMLSSWSIDGYRIYQTSIDRYALTPQVEAYFIGPTGDFVAPRPIRITAANLVLTSTSPETRNQLTIIRSAEEWAQISMPEIAAPWPWALYLDGAAPDSKLYLYGMPTEQNDIELFTWTALKTDFAAVTDDIDLADGYEEAIVSNFALKIAGLYPHEAVISQDTRDLARTSLHAIRIMNAKCPPIVSEAVGVGGRGSDAPINTRSAFYRFGT